MRSEIKLLPTMIVGLMVVLGLWIGTSIPAGSPDVPVVEVVHATPDNPLDRARMASFDLMLDSYYTAGSATNISRVKDDNGEYLYRAITAYHVIEDMERAMVDDPVGASRTVTLTFQLGFHDEPLAVTVDVIEFDWYIKQQDWATFTYRTHHLFECAEVASEENFKAIKAFDPIYVIAAFGPYGQQCRQGLISTTHNVSVLPDRQRQSSWPWNNQPENFFRISIPIWYGDSGGGVFDQWGRLIGITNAFTIRGGPAGQLVTHSGVCFKAHIMRDITKYSKDFLKVED